MIAIPSSLIEGLDRSPRDRPVVVLLRHSERPPIPKGELGQSLPLTTEGVALASGLGRIFGGRLLGLRSSPIRRCLETGSAIAIGAEGHVQVTPDRLLEGPGSYVAEEKAALDTFLTVGHEAMLMRTMRTRKPLPGFHEPTAAARRLIESMLGCAKAGRQPGFHVFVTHDFLITLTAAMAFDEVLERPDWPRFLEGLFAWEGDTGDVIVRYRGRERPPSWSRSTVPS